MTSLLASLLAHDSLAPALHVDAAAGLAADIGRAAGIIVYPRSLAATEHALLFLARRDNGKVVCALTTVDSLAPFKGDARTVMMQGERFAFTAAGENADLAARMRELLPYLHPRRLGLQTSAGCGDRLGLATPGHIQGLRATYGNGSDEDIRIAPIFAQQSIRENARTGRTPQEVLDDAMWGVFQEGWRQGYGADADHLKTFEDVDVCAEAGYTFYTVDPGEYVNDRANSASGSELRAMARALPWDVLEDSETDLLTRLTGNPIDLALFQVELEPLDVMRAAAKYGQALAHTLRMYHHLHSVTHDVEFEMSVDETETVTTLAEHIYIAGELRRLGVECVSLAPRYVGTFEKGVDYIGDIEAFEASFRQHHAIAETFGPYKLSLHSGSDKFRVYPVAHAVAGDLVHLKTAGTSYLEALRAIASIDPALFRAIVRFACERYPVDRASYHVSAELDKMVAVDALPDERLAETLEDFHAREILHVTFGSVLNSPDFRQPFFEALRANEAVYDAVLARHFVRHFEPFS